MARQSTRLAEAHRQAQSRLGVETINLLRVAARLLEVTNIAGSQGRWLLTVVPIIETQAARSAAIAADYLRVARSLDITDIDGWVPERVVPSRGQIATSMRTQGPVEALRLTALGRAIPDIRRSVIVSTVRSGQRLALAGGRRTIVTSIRRDDRAVGWARLGVGHSCGFCAMLISRGPVYKSDTVGFRAHDNCNCGVRAIYREGEGWTQAARDYQRLWNALKTDGLAGRDLVNAFRRTVEAA